MTRIKKGKEYYSNIITMRTLEDCIRATRKYTEGIRTIRKSHPVQGEEFPTPVFYKHYEVYPEMEVGLNMDVKDFFDWLWRATPCIDVMFHYDYRANKASILVKDGNSGVNELKRAIPGFDDVLKGIDGVRRKSKA